MLLAPSSSREFGEAWHPGFGQRALNQPSVKPIQLKGCNGCGSAVTKLRVAEPGLKFCQDLLLPFARGSGGARHPREKYEAALKTASNSNGHDLTL